MSATPRLRTGAFASSPPTARTTQSTSRFLNSSGLAARTSTGPSTPTNASRPALKSLAAEKTQSQIDPPLIPLEFLDAPSQRFYIFAFWLALHLWRLYDFYHLNLDETESLWLFMKWVSIDGVFLFGLPSLRIPWLEWSSTTMTVLFMLHAIADALLMFRIPVPLTAWLFALSKLLYDRELSVSERYVKPGSVLNDASRILGRTIVHVLPEGSAKLNPESLPFALDSSRTAVVQLPLAINQTKPILVELLRFDLETDANETIIIANSQMRKLRKDAEREGRHAPNEPLTLHIPAKKTGLYRLQRMVDESKLEVQVRPSEALVVAKPSARIILKERDRCRGDLSNLWIEVQGTPPLKVIYKKSSKEGDRDIAYQGIQPDDFLSPSSVSGSNSAVIRSGAEDLSWAKSYTIRVPLNETLSVGGKLFYSIEQVSDARGNDVSYSAEKDDYERPKSKAAHLEASLEVHERPSVFFKASDVQRPLRVPKGLPTELPIQYGSTGRGIISDATHQVSYFFTSAHALGPDGEHSDERTVVDLALKSPHEKPKISEPGLYTLRSVSTPFCIGEVLEPSSVTLMNPPQPDMLITTEEIFDNCAGSPIGLRLSLDLLGTPPFDIEYSVKREGQRGAESKTLNVKGNRYTTDFQPVLAGKHQLLFTSIRDAVYQPIPFKGRSDLMLEQTVKPAATASFANPSTKSICMDESASFWVDLRGEPPFTLEYEFVQGKQREKKTEVNITADGFEIRTGPLTVGGEYTINLLSVTDNVKCKQMLQEGVKVNVRQQKPKASFGKIEGNTSLKSLEGKTISIPVRLQGERPWIVEYKNKLDGRVHREQFNDQNDRLPVKGKGVYELLSVRDDYCPGVIDPAASTFEITEISRPRISLPASLQIEKNAVIKPEVCEGVEDSLSISFEGQQPFELKWQENRKPDSSQHSVRQKTEVIPMNNMRIHLNTAQSGLYEYKFSELGDHNYAHDARKHESVLVRQRVLPRPSVEFSTPGKIYSFCQGAQTATSSELIPIKLTGQPPFAVNLEIRHQGRASRPQVLVIKDIQSTTHNIEIPHSFLQPGNSALLLTRVADSRGCERLLTTPGSPRVQIAVHDPPSIAALEPRYDFCIGEYLQFSLTGVAPYTIYHTFDGKEYKATADAGIFKRFADRAGNFTVIGVSDSASTCRAAVKLTKVIHPMPTARLSQGRDNRVDIHAGSETELGFAFTGTPPFEFTFTRSENSRRGDRGRPGAVLETRTMASDEHRFSVKAGEEGTYEVIAIRDAYCSFAKPGTDSLRKVAGGGKKLLKDE